MPVRSAWGLTKKSTPWFPGCLTRTRRTQSTCRSKSNLNLTVGVDLARQTARSVKGNAGHKIAARHQSRATAVLVSLKLQRIGTRQHAFVPTRGNRSIGRQG